MKNRSNLLIALLGILVGVLLILVVQKCGTNRPKSVDNGTWRKLNLILESIDANYVDSVDHKAVTDAAVKAALAKLDPHTIYLPPQELRDSESDLSGHFEGIGIQFNVPNDTAIVLEVIPGGPSEKIGLLSGDRIIKVDSTVIAGVKFPQDSMVRRMKGPAGTKVLITVKRAKETIPFLITRGKIPTHSVDASFMVNDTTGYLRLGKFSATTLKEVYIASEELLSSGMKHLIFDVRGNSGGFFDQALNLSNLFLPKDAPIVYMEGRKRNREEYSANGAGNMKDVKLSVLIDEGSASSSEIFAGAMQDNARAKIIGRRSFGKGLVQEPVYFSDGSGVRITVARFYTPSGRCLQKPYSDDYDYEIFKRYNTGEMVAADSMRVEMGGILPDVFVPADTTKATKFYIDCNRKATPMRFASAFFDAHKDELQSIDDFGGLLKYLDGANLASEFLHFASSVDGLRPTASEMEEFRTYTLTQVRALVGRYSKLGDKAFYHIYLDVDKVVKAALTER